MRRILLLGFALGLLVIPAACHNEMDFDPFGRLSRFECGVRQLLPAEVRRAWERFIRWHRRFVARLAASGVTEGLFSLHGGSARGMTAR